MTIVEPYEGERGIVFDGFYISDSQIDAVEFVSESILFVLIKGKEGRVLYAPNFY